MGLFFPARERSFGEQVIRGLAMLLVFGAVIWAFWAYNQRVIERLNADAAVQDETGTLTERDEIFIREFLSGLRNEYALNGRIRVTKGPVETPESDNDTLAIAISPPNGQAEVAFPALMRRALGADFEAAVAQRLADAAADPDADAWRRELKLSLVDIWTALAGPAPDPATGTDDMPTDAPTSGEATDQAGNTP